MFFPQPQNSQVGVESKSTDAQGTQGSQGAGVGVGRCQTLLVGEGAQERWSGDSKSTRKSAVVMRTLVIVERSFCPGLGKKEV